MAHSAVATSRAVYHAACTLPRSAPYRARAVWRRAAGGGCPRDDGGVPCAAGTRDCAGPEAPGTPPRGMFPPAAAGQRGPGFPQTAGWGGPRCWCGHGCGSGRGHGAEFPCGGRCGGGGGGRGCRWLRCGADGRRFRGRGARPAHSTATVGIRAGCGRSAGSGRVGPARPVLASCASGSPAALVAVDKG